MYAESEYRQTLSCVHLYPFMGNFLSRVCPALPEVLAH